eukprot:gnl/TRDRNA2_/TRDRNA2_165802_c0_seq1.p1 gnl/TRDRNA2_/TRDRNA2_165802_c0~~gnl/TRDRNA2_/TRDRNA2_165802_c0_seq1.p1  ORF type:complete len:182 (+),score=33.99 gnl/TRDRNA2_/TRDRNA2_165802_c0_seq1:68-613(+)
MPFLDVSLISFATLAASAWGDDCSHEELKQKTRDIWSKKCPVDEMQAWMATVDISEAYRMGQQIEAEAGQQLQHLEASNLENVDVHLLERYEEWWATAASEAPLDEMCSAACEDATMQALYFCGSAEPRAYLRTCRAYACVGMIRSVTTASPSELSANRSEAPFLVVPLLFSLFSIALAKC